MFQKTKYTKSKMVSQMVARSFTEGRSTQALLILRGHLGDFIIALF